MTDQNPGVLIASGGDVPLISFSGERPDVVALLQQHGADAIMLSPPLENLAFLRPAAPLLRRLFIDGECADLGALADLSDLEVLLLSRPTSFEPLAHLGKLTRLSVGGHPPWHQLAACQSLRELIVYGNPDAGTDTVLSDLTPLRGLEHLEYLRLVRLHLTSLDGIDALRALRSLVLVHTYTDTPAAEAYVRQRFGFDVTAIVPRRPADERRLGEASWYLHADQVEAERVLGAVPSERLYGAAVTCERPGCVVLLVDRSGSMRGTCGSDHRAQRKADTDGLTEAELGELERSLGSELTRSEAVARAVNRFLPALATRCGDHARVEVALIEYGERVGYAWAGRLAGRALVPLDEVLANPIRTGPDGPAWIDAEARGRTRLGKALRLTASLIESWCRAHPDSFPPVVINLFGADPDEGDVYRDAWAVRCQATLCGPALLFWIAKPWDYSYGMFAVDELISGSEHHYRLASPMPPTVADAARRAGYPFLGTVRGSFGDAAPDDIQNVLHIFTTIPGIPWSDACVRHALPPLVPTKEELTSWKVDRRAGRVAPDFTPPRLKRPMTADVFWQVIEKTRKGISDSDEHGERILETLGQFDEADLIAFDGLLSQRLAESHRHDLWAVAFIALGGCSDDAFDYFQCWLVSQGRKYFESALADPQKAAQRIKPGDEAQFERLRYLAAEAYEAKTGRQDYATRRQRVPRPLLGTPWGEDDLAAMYPRLYRRYA